MQKILVRAQRQLGVTGGDSGKWRDIRCGGGLLESRRKSTGVGKTEITGGSVLEGG